MNTTSYFVRARDLQIEAFRRGKKALAKRLGAKLRAMRAEHPHLAHFN